MAGYQLWYITYDVWFWLGWIILIIFLVLVWMFFTNRMKEVTV